MKGTHEAGWREDEGQFVSSTGWLFPRALESEDGVRASVNWGNELGRALGRSHLESWEQGKLEYDQWLISQGRARSETFAGTWLANLQKVAA